jgi:hypothetical protein
MEDLAVGGIDTLVQGPTDLSTSHHMEALVDPQQELDPYHLEYHQVIMVEEPMGHSQDISQLDPLGAEGVEMDIYHQEAVEVVEDIHIEDMVEVPEEAEAVVLVEVEEVTHMEAAVVEVEAEVLAVVVAADIHLLMDITVEHQEEGLFTRLI